VRDRYDLSLGETGFLIGASLLGSTISLVPWGILADRIGERIVLGVGLGTCGLALLGAAEVHSFAALAALLVFAGCAGASVQSASGRAVLGWFPPSRRGLALGIRQTAIPIGGFAVALVLPHFDVAGSFRLLGLACIVTAALGVALIREGPEPILPLDGARANGPFRNRRLWILSGSAALLLWPQMCLVGFTVLFLHDTRGMTTAHAALALALVQVIGIGTRIGSGAWSDALGSRIVPLRRIAIVLAGLTALTAVLVGAPLEILVPVLIVTGGLAMSWNGLAFAAAAEVAGGARAGSAIGLQQTVINSTAAILPPLFGALVGAAGWGVGVGLIALGPLASFVVLRPLAPQT
jgi:sugar phosphate permease